MTIGKVKPIAAKEVVFGKCPMKYVSARLYAEVAKVAGIMDNDILKNRGLIGIVV